MKKRILVISLTIIFLGLFLFQVDSSAQMRQRPQRNVDRENFLDLTPEQKDQFKELRKGRLEENKQLFEKMKNLRQSLRDLKQDPEASEKKIDNMIDEITKLQANRMKLAFRHRQELKKILTPEQLEKLEKTREIFQRLRDRGPERGLRQGRNFRGCQFLPRGGFYHQRVRGWWRWR